MDLGQHRSKRVLLGPVHRRDRRRRHQRVGLLDPVDLQPPRRPGHRDRQPPAGGTATVTSYAYNNGHGTTSGQPNTLTTSSTTGGTAGSSAWTYDADGDTTSQSATAGGTAQDECYDYTPGGQLSQAWPSATLPCAGTAPSGTSTRYVYDTDGNLLAADNPASDTVYVFGEQITATLSGGTTTGITGLRFILLPGGAQAVRTGAGTSYYFETSDLHGTSVVAINNTLQDPVWLQFTPYGAPRSTATGAWPDTNGYLGDPVSASDGLTTIGQRQYDSTTGRFLTPDPVLEAGDPTQMGGYAYAADNPVSDSDPTGLSVPGRSICIDNPNCNGPGDPGSSGSGTASASNTGSGYVGLGPGVQVQTGDTKLHALAQTYHDFLQFYGFGSSGIVNAAQNDAVWFQVCQQNPGLCPSSMYLSLWRSFLPGGTSTTVLGGGVFFIGQGGGGQGSAGEAEWRSLADPDSMVGATLDQLRALVPEGWIEKPLSKGGLSGVRFLSPGKQLGRLGSVRYVEGAPDAGSGQQAEAIHDGGDYIHVEIGGLQYWAAADGNAAIGNPDVPSAVVKTSGSTGPVDLGDGIDFGAADG